MTEEKIFRYVYEIDYVDAPPRNLGFLDVEFTEREKSYVMKVIRSTIRDLPPILDRLLQSGKAIVKKRGSQHAMRFGTGFFVIYPERLGTPFVFWLLE